MFSQGLAQQGALQTVGEQKQTLAQKALDEQYYKYLEQKAFPEEQLAKYSGFVYGNPLLSQRDVTSTAQGGRNFNQPSSGAQLLGTGLAAANTFRQIAPQTFGSFTSAINPFKGGGGLSDIIYRDNGGQAQRRSKVGETSALVQAATERARRLRQQDPNYIIPEVEINREELIPAGQEFAGGVYAKEMEKLYGPTAIAR